MRVGTESVNIAVLSGPGRARQKKPIFCEVCPLLSLVGQTQESPLQKPKTLPFKIVKKVKV